MCMCRRMCIFFCVCVCVRVRVRACVCVKENKRRVAAELTLLIGPLLPSLQR